VQQRGARAHLGHTIAQPRRAQREAGVQVAVEHQRAHRAAVEAARALLVVLDELQRVGLRRARHRHGPGVGQKRVEGVAVRAQRAHHVVHRVHQAAVDLHLPAPDDPHAARLADARLVVAVHVGAHGQLVFFLHVVEQRSQALRVLEGVGAARDGARDGASLHHAPPHPHEHLGGRAHQVLTGAQVHDEAVRCWIQRAQRGVEVARPHVRGSAERLAQHHLEQVAAREGLESVAHPGLELGLGVVALGGPQVGATRQLVRGIQHGSREPTCGGRVHRQLVGHALGAALLGVQEHQLIGQVQHQVAQPERLRQLHPHGLEAEPEAVAERAVQPQQPVARVAQVRHQGAQQVEHGGRTAALLLGLRGHCGAHARADDVVGDVHVHERAGPAHHGQQQAQQRRPAWVQPGELHTLAAARDAQRRVHQADVVAAVAPGVLEAGAQQHAGLRVERARDGRQGSPRLGERERQRVTLDVDTTTGDVVRGGARLERGR
jgi:hypothetical protein